jgi:hypothetical protein
MTIQEDSTNAGGSEAMPCGMMCAGNVVGPNWTNDKKGQQMNDVLVYCVRVQYRKTRYMSNGAPFFLPDFSYAFNQGKYEISTPLKRSDYYLLNGVEISYFPLLKAYEKSGRKNGAPLLM